MPEEYPDARVVVSVASEGHENVGDELDKLNPILKEILVGKGRPGPEMVMRGPKFGKLTFSQRG